MPYLPPDRYYLSERAQQLKQVWDSLTAEQQEQLLQALTERIERLQAEMSRQAVKHRKP